MDISAPVYPAIGAIVAAMIVGGISFLVSVLAKDQKTSEFRQAWIDRLGDEFAEYISHFQVMTAIIRAMLNDGKSQDEISKYLRAKDELFLKVEKIEARIKLRINPREHKKMLGILTRVHDYLRLDISDSKKADKLVNELLEEAQVILKKEWKRVKRGEPVFFITKMVSLSILIAALSLGVAYTRSHFRISQLPGADSSSSDAIKQHRQVGEKEVVAGKKRSNTENAEYHEEGFKQP